MDAADVVAERREEKRTAAQSAAAESEAAAAKKRKTTQKTLSFAKKQVALKEEDSVVVDDDVTSENVETQVEPVKVKLDDPLAKDIFGDDEEEGADVLVEDRTYAVEDKENVVMAASPTLLPPSTAASKLEKFKLVAKNAEAPTATDDDHTVSKITPVEGTAPDTASIDMELA